MTLTELAERVGMTLANLAILNTGEGPEPPRWWWENGAYRGRRDFDHVH